MGGGGGGCIIELGLEEIMWVHLPGSGQGQVASSWEQCNETTG
jgi:hypothetical protein